MRTRFSYFLALLTVAAFAGCGGHGSTPATSTGTLAKPNSVSPGLIKPGSMAKTKILPASVMRSPSNRRIDLVGRGWAEVPGTASQVAASPDGSLWVLSDQPAGPDKYIWHYVNGAWQNISGMASELAVPPAAGNNFLYAVNSVGGVWIYNISTATWFSIGGGVKSIALDTNGDLYAVSNSTGGDAALWEYPSGSSSSWQQIEGSGTIVGGNADQNPYTLPSGSIGPNPGTFILNSAGSIYYENIGASGMSFGSIPGAASAVAPTTNAGVFVLGYPANSSGQTLYYYNFAMPGWVAESGSGVSISDNPFGLYVVGASGAIYQTTASGFIFGGGSETQTFTSSGGTFAFPQTGTYDQYGINGSVTWGANNTTSSFPFQLSWGFGSDLPAPFTFLPSSIGSALIYFDFLPLTSTTAHVDFTATPAMTISSTVTMPGTKCGFAFFNNAAGGGFSEGWNSMTGAGVPEVTPTASGSGSTFTIPSQSLPPGQTIDESAGQDAYFALYCH